MKRIRRTPEQARDAILDAARHLLLSKGQDALRLQTIAAEVGVSHPAVLHHFGSMDAIVEALHQRLSRQIRDDLLNALNASTGGGSAGGIATAMQALSHPNNGRILAWLVASGRDPFPPAEEQGLAVISQRISETTDDVQPERVDLVVQLAVLAMFGEALVGDAVRARLGRPDDPCEGDRFRTWLLGELGRMLRPVTEPKTPRP